MNKLPKKVFITGGHLTPAVAVIDEIIRRNVPWEIVFIGRTHAVEGSFEKAKEEEVITSKKIRFVALTTGRLQRAFSLYTIVSLIKIPFGFVQAFILCAREKPDIVVSFGGYIALPVVVASYVLRIPVLTHEQTRVPGLANRIIALFARKICISFPDTGHTFGQKKTVYTGLPIRKEILETSKPAFSLPAKKYPLIYITGGTTGSVTLNNILFGIVEELLDRYTVIHQTGQISFHEAMRVRDQIDERKRSRYIIKDYFDQRTVGWIIRTAHLVICRSGANTVMELAILRKRAILIPLPWSGGAEQLENARWLRDLGLGYIVAQNTANHETIFEGIRWLLGQPANSRVMNVNEIRKDGAARVADEIAGLLL